MPTYNEEYMSTHGTFRKTLKWAISDGKWHLRPNGPDCELQYRYNFPTRSYDADYHLADFLRRSAWTMMSQQYTDLFQGLARFRRQLYLLALIGVARGPKGPWPPKFQKV